MKIKYFSENKVILTDGHGAFEYVLETKNDTEKFDRDLLEDILDWEPNRMNIIIEGIDGSGKTTLANKLVENYHLNNNIHLTAKTENDFKFHMGLLINNQKTVFDRFHFSEFNVFSTLYNRKTKLTHEEWDEVITFLNECSKTHAVVLLNDIAYIDFSSRQKEAKTYFGQFDKISDNVIVVVSFSLSKSMTSYGLRCGAAIILGQKKESVNQVKIVFEKNARATWSNINNGAMETFVDVLDNHGEEYDQERLKYVHLLKERGDIFTTEADEVGLKYYPYKEGFFVTLAMDNETRDKYHEALMANNIFTVKVNLGIRVAICSLSVEKTKGLAKKMKDILDTIQ